MKSYEDAESEEERLLILTNILKDKSREEIISALDIAYQLLQEHDRLLETIPPCEEHGKCIPHAIEWVKARRN